MVGCGTIAPAPSPLGAGNAQIALHRVRVARAGFTVVAVAAPPQPVGGTFGNASACAPLHQAVAPMHAPPDIGGAAMPRVLPIGAVVAVGIIIIAVLIIRLKVAVGRDAHQRRQQQERA